MAQPVFLLVLAKGWTEAWYQLSSEEQAQLWARVEEIDKRAGAIWRLQCQSRWADEEIAGWSVIEYPDIETYQHKVKELEALQWWRYFSAKTILGTKSEESG